MIDALFRKQGITQQALSKVGWGLLLLPVVWFVVWIGLHIHSLGAMIEIYARKQFDLGPDYAMGVLWWMILAFVILALGGESRQMLLLAWIGKFFVVLVVMLFFEQRYGLDGYHFFQLKLTGSHWMYEGYDWRTDSLIPALQPLAATGGGILGPGIGTENSLRFAMIIASITGSYYHAMKVAYAFLGLLGVWWFYRAVVVVLGRPCPAVFYLLAFFPSILFWSSILGKDPLQLLFLGLYAYGGAVWFVERRLSAFWFIGVGCFGCYLLRTWIGLMCMAVLALATILGRCRAWQASLMILLFLPVYYYGSEQFQMQFRLQSLDTEVLLVYLQTLADGYTLEARPELRGGADLTEIRTVESAVASLPLAMFSGLFRPLPFDITNPFTALAALENSVVLLLALTALVRFRPVYLRDPLVLWPGLFVLMWAALYGAIVMANFGAGVRYKLQVWPFLLILLLSMTHKEGRAWLQSRVPGKLPISTSS